MAAFLFALTARECSDGAQLRCPTAVAPSKAAESSVNASSFAKKVCQMPQRSLRGGVVGIPDILETGETAVERKARGRKVVMDEVERGRTRRGRRQERPGARWAT